MKMNCLLVVALTFFTAGCVGGRPPQTTEHYMLDYAPPVLGKMAVLDDIFKVERFSTAQLFNSNAIVYKTSSFSLNSYPHDRWQASPGDLVTDYLVRDFRSAGLFRAIFSYRDPETTRFSLEGYVMEFLEVREQGTRKALLTLHVTLLDMSKKENPQKVVFQKLYSHAATCEEKGPGGVALGLSESMARLSGQIISDAYYAVKSLHNEQNQRPD